MIKKNTFDRFLGDFLIREFMLVHGSRNSNKKKWKTCDRMKKSINLTRKRGDGEAQYEKYGTNIKRVHKVSLGLMK